MGIELESRESGDREKTVFVRHRRLLAANEYVEQACENLTLYIEESDIAPTVSAWTEFMDALAAVAWNLRTILDAHGQPAAFQFLDPLRTYEATCKWLARCVRDRAHPFEYLLKQIIDRDSDFDPNLVPNAPEDSVEEQGNIWSITPPDGSEPPSALRSLGGSSDSYPTVWGGAEAAERDALIDLRRLAFCTVIVARRASRVATGESIGDFAQKHLKYFYDDPVALFFVALGLTSDPTSSRQRNMLAQQYARMVIAKFPDQPGSYHLLARSLIENLSVLKRQSQEEALEEAEELVSRSLVLDPSYHKFHFTRARIRLERSDFRGAEDDIASAKELLQAVEGLGSDTEKQDMERYEELHRDVRRRETLSATFEDKVNHLKQEIQRLDDIRRTVDESLQGSVRAESTARMASEVASENRLTATEFEAEVGRRIDSIRKESLAAVGLWVGIIGTLVGTVSFARDGFGRDGWRLFPDVVLPAGLFVVLLGLSLGLYFAAVNIWISREQRQRSGATIRESDRPSR